MDKVPGEVSKQIALKSLYKLHFSGVFFMHNFLALNNNGVPVRFAGAGRGRGLNLRGRAGNILHISAN